jgi:hypothetical protein
MPYTGYWIPDSEYGGFATLSLMRRDTKLKDGNI